VPDAVDSTAAVEAVFRMEFPRVVASLAHFTADLDLAEELAQEALVDALRQWPRDGTPRNPGAWLTAVGKRKAIDQFRRNRTLEDKYRRLGHELLERTRSGASPDGDGLDADSAGASSGASHDDIDNDRLGLIFVACHPVLPVPGRVALTLRLVGGLTVAEIARAYLVPEATIAQRIVRAKKTIAKAGVPFEIPSGPERTERLGAVLEVVYLIFNEGYTATAGEDWLRPELCHEALRLGRVLAALMPDDGEVHGLVALMEFQSSRLAARVGPSGRPVLLLHQDRHTWDRLLIRRGEDALARAETLNPTRGGYTLQAAIAACHARAFRSEETDWAQLVSLYDELARVMPSPIVELNRAVVVSMANGPAAALPLVDALADTGALARYHLLHSVRGDLLEKLGRHFEAAIEFDRAAALAQNGPERRLGEDRARASRSAIVAPAQSSHQFGSQHHGDRMDGPDDSNNRSTKDGAAVFDD
jgi:RNA polymerase sigma-70 factor, ECF subfamily